LNYQAKIDRLTQRGRAAELHEAEIKNRPTDEEYEKNKKNAVFANRLITLDIFPWDKLLDTLEKSVPEGITLSGFDPSDDLKQILIKGRAGTLENIAYLLKMLEKSSILQSSLLRICLSESKPGGLPSVKTEDIEFEAAIFLKTETPDLK
jgi:Tfp pilus assembly protein PilN